MGRQVDTLLGGQGESLYVSVKYMFDVFSYCYIYSRLKLARQIYIAAILHQVGVKYPQSKLERSFMKKSQRDQGI